MTVERVGILSREDPLHQLLAALLDDGEFEVYKLGREGAVYLYRHLESGARCIGKFYGRKWMRTDSVAAEDLRSLLLRREFDNLDFLRRRGFADGLHRVPRPLAMADAIDWVLIEEFVEGCNVHHAIRDALFVGYPLLEQTIDAAAESLARLHRVDPPAGLLPRKDISAYFAKVLAQLRYGHLLSNEERERLAAIGKGWDTSDMLSDFEPVMIHGDTTPEHFLYDGGSQRMSLIDVESLRLGDPAEDLGYLAGEIKHLFWTYTRDPWSSELTIRHLYDAYARAAKLSDREAKGLTDRARYFMGCAELRIARNAWLPFNHRRDLVAEAQRCLTI